MPKKSYTAEQIVTLLRQVEVAVGQGKSVPITCREASISDVSFYRWRKEYGGLQLDQAKRIETNQKPIRCRSRSPRSVTGDSSPRTTFPSRTAAR